MSQQVACLPLTPEQSLRIQALLSNNDVATLDAEFHSDISLPILNDWVLDNVLDVMANHTLVLDAWLARVPPRTRADILYDRVAVALQSLDDEDKARVLRGHDVDGAVHPAHRNLRNYLRSLSAHWYTVSPLWVGKPGSSLRQAATELGWDPKLLVIMAKNSMRRHANWEAWIDQVPYVYSMMACHWIGLQRIRDLPSWAKLNAGGKPVEGDFFVVSSRANPVDVALARHILELTPTPLKDQLIANPEVAQVAEELSFRLQDLVRVHQGLNLFHEFAVGLAFGRLPGIEATPGIAIALPDLGS